MIYSLKVQNDELSCEGYFPSAGPFGSADGVGGQGAIHGRNGRTFVIAGDQTGRIYMLSK